MQYLDARLPKVMLFGQVKGLNPAGPRKICKLQTSLQNCSEQACLARHDLGHTHLAHVLECTLIRIVVIVIIAVITIIRLL